VVTSLGHHDEQHPVRAKARSIVKRLADFGGRGVTNDENVFSTTKVHASVDDGEGALGHFFLMTNLKFLPVRFLVQFSVHRHRFWLPLGEVDHLFNVRINEVFVLAV
jgi:hypothetical protein